jgi:glycyl-tRNA synthetase beta subunit
MRLDFCTPGYYVAGVVSLVVFLATFCTPRRPARPCVDLHTVERERERGEAAEEAQTANKAQPPPQDIVQRLAPKRGVMVLHLQFILFVKIKTLNRRKSNITSHIHSIVGELKTNVIKNLEWHC